MPFAAGISGNSNGRRVGTVALRTVMRRAQREALSVLAGMVQDQNIPADLRLEAANSILRFSDAQSGQSI
jgi:hypothetical protein